MVSFARLADVANCILDPLIQGAGWATFKIIIIKIRDIGGLTEFSSVRKAWDVLMLIQWSARLDPLLLLVDKIHGEGDVAKVSREKCISSYDRFDR